MPQRKFDSGYGEWILRREAAEICAVNVRTVQRWLNDAKAHRLRTKTIERGRQRITLLHRGDVERIRSERLEHPLEHEVIASLLRGDLPATILADRRLSLDDFERIRDQFVRVVGARTIQGQHVRDICEALEVPELHAPLVVTALRALRDIRKLLDVGQADYPTLVAAVKELLERHSRLVAERRRAGDARTIVKPIETNDTLESAANDALPPASSRHGSSQLR